MNINELNKVSHTYNFHINKKSYKKWLVGGYGTIYLSSNDNKIYKKIDKYNTVLKKSNTILDIHNIENYILYPSNNTILETIMSKFLNNIFDIKVYDIYSSVKNIYINQEYCGISLYSSVRHYILYDYIPDIIYKLLIECYKMNINGIQHTDITLQNILYNIYTNHTELHLIDYSCISVKSIKNNNYKWSNSIGIWRTLDPQIILYDNINDNSIIWTIGIIICDLLDKSPFENKYSHIIDSINKKYNSNNYVKDYGNDDTWKEIYINTIKYDKINSQDIFADIYCDIDNKYGDILKKMLVWDNKNRISLEELIKLWENTFNIVQRVDLYNITPYYYNILPIRKNRENIINEVYDFCKDCNNLDKFSYMVFIIDSISCMYDNNNLHIIIYSVWLIVSYIYGNSCTDYEEDIVELQYIKNKYKKDITAFEYINEIYKICEYTGWKLYQKIADVTIKEEGYIIDYTVLRDIFINIDRRYSMEDIYKFYIIYKKEELVKHNNKKRRTKSI